MFSTLEEETPMDDLTQNTAPKPPPIFISGVTNTKPLIDLLNALAPNKYLVKTLPNDQVEVQPTGSSIYTAIIKALMDKTPSSAPINPDRTEASEWCLKISIPPQTLTTSNKH